YAYAISFSVASTSGSGIAAKNPNRFGWSAASFAAYSLHARARWLVTALSPNHKPGLVMETTEAATLPRSMSSIDLAGVQVVFAGCRSGRPLTSATHTGGPK